MAGGGAAGAAAGQAAVTGGAGGSGAGAGGAGAGVGGIGESGAGAMPAAGVSGGGTSPGGAGMGGGGTEAGGTGGTGGTDSGPLELVTPIDRGGTYVLEFGDTYFAAQAAGGKVVEFRRGSGTNLLTGSSVNDINFGSTLWTSPQSEWGWPPAVELDSNDYTVTVDEAAGSITMVSQVATSVGPSVSVTKVFSADLVEEAIDISYTITNGGDAQVQLSAWEVTRVQPGGLSFFPAGMRTGQDGDTLTAENMADHFWYDHAANPANDEKLFADGAGGWLAFTDGTDLFVKAWTDVPAGSQAPGDAEVEMYDGTGYVELEVQGSYDTLSTAAPDNTTTLNERWYVRPLPDGAQRAVGDAGLVTAVTELLGPG